MISEGLKTYIIEQFKKRESELLLAVVTCNGTARYTKIPFTDDEFKFILATYDNETRRFIELDIEVYNQKGNKFETINLI